MDRTWDERGDEAEYVRWWNGLAWSSLLLMLVVVLVLFEKEKQKQRRDEFLATLERQRSVHRLVSDFVVFLLWLRNCCPHRQCRGHPLRSGHAVQFFEGGLLQERRVDGVRWKKGTCPCPRWWWVW